jgi:hypothetical protein
VGCGGKAPLSWPAGSPDLNPLHFVFLLGYLKTKVYASAVYNRDKLRRRIKNFFSKIKNTPGIFERLSIYFRTELSCVSEDMEAILSTSSKKLKN